MNATKAIFKTFFLSLCVIANIHFAFAQTTGGIIPNGQNVFLDNNGKPLSGGKVFFYTGNVGSTVPKTTFQDINLTTPNTNPVILDASGRPHSGTGLWGTGNYRQVVQDKNNNLIWDVLTSAAGSGSSGGGGTATGDGDLVGTIKPWAGMIAPNQYMFAYGAQISRTTFSALFTAITSAQSVFCNSGSPILNGLGDTTNFWIGMTVEVSCVPTGVSTVLSKTSGSVTLNANANVTVNTNATFFPWGNGNGVNTFTLPDLRGVVPMGNNIMGGVASSNMSDVNFGPQGASSSGALGGSQSEALLPSNAPNVSNTFVGIQGTATSTGNFANGLNLSTSNAVSPGGGSSYATSETTATVNSTFTPTGTISSLAGGIAVSSTIVAAGSAYPVSSSVTLTVVGGTCTIAPQFTVSTSGGGALTGTPALLTAGRCSVVPSNPVATTSSGTGTGGTLNVIYSAVPFSLVQPSITVNYIVKVTPDANSATANGVTDINGMTGSIGCGSGLLCTGNSIIATNPANVVGPATSAVGDITIFNNNTGTLLASPSWLFADTSHQMIGVGTVTPFADNNNAAGSVIRNDNNGITRLGVINRSNGSSAIAQINFSLNNTGGTGANLSNGLNIVSTIPTALEFGDSLVGGKVFGFTTYDFENQTLSTNFAHLDATSFHVFNTTTSTNAVTGSGIFNGGVGIAGDLFVGSSINLLTNAASQALVNIQNASSNTSAAAYHESVLSNVANATAIFGLLNGTTPSANILIGSGVTTFNIAMNAINIETLTKGGGVQIGSPTGGDKGAGAINAVTCFINNVACAPIKAPVVCEIISTSAVTCNNGTSPANNGVYTSPAGTTRLEVEGVGGAGGGAGSGTSPAAAGDGGTTTFGTSLLTAPGGTKGLTTGVQCTVSAATGGDQNITGGLGGITTGAVNQGGGAGGISYYGGAGPAPPQNNVGYAAAANSGSGGSGAGNGVTGNTGGGGCAGSFFKAVLTTVLSTYNYAIGALGTAGGAGTSGSAGGAGSLGRLRVVAYFN